MIIIVESIGWRKIIDAKEVIPYRLVRARNSVKDQGSIVSSCKSGNGDILNETKRSGMRRPHQTLTIQVSNPVPIGFNFKLNLKGMKEIKDLNEECLIEYSKIVIFISSTLSFDKDFARSLLMEPKTDGHIVQFLADVYDDMDLVLYTIEFNRDTKDFSYGSEKADGWVLIPNGLFHDLIYYV